MKHLVAGLVVFSMTLATVMAQPAGAPKVPKGKWFEGDRGYQEALELQKQTGADILLYFFRHDASDEKGLCTWWERHGLQNGRVSKFLQDYIKVKVKMPLKPSARETFAPFKFNKTPAVYIVRAGGGFPVRCPVFNWPNNKPELKSAQELITMFTQASGPKAEAVPLSDNE
ncbi:MAG TPA: hypothetical protein PKE26_03530 [Kiritimatiellia bacterium]|nr:hypothetical protein [Kiritimatiellia bacterium]HMO98161.1 hypothetical protein [Kiritimatiellia bacterium]HMP96673.1 hypothetical protein [Kiritimatiellia bacterium]